MPFDLDILDLQWALLLLFGLGFYLWSPLSTKVSEFFSAADGSGRSPGVWMLMSSLVISWIFAKSITNAADLALDFGLVGGVAYASYYLSFVVAGVVIYRLRTVGGFDSIHDFLRSRFGRRAVLIFSLLVGFRLFNEVWSNTMVIGSYFGAQGSGQYYAAVVAFTLLTLAYTLKGGLRSSLLSDAVQMLFFGLLLVVIFSFILPASESGLVGSLSSGEWTLATGVDLLLVALLQSLSYPFHDPVLTDRGFIATPSTTLKSYLGAAIIGFFCILLFSYVGVFARENGLSAPAAVNVGKLLGVGAMLVVNFIMVTSAASTLDSAFSSFSKLWVIDLGQGGERPLRKGRLTMIVLAVAGTLPIFFSPTILSATTVSGTMVMGLAPVFLLWRLQAPPSSFYLSVGLGIAVGIALATGLFPDRAVLTEGVYDDLLWANIWGLLLCFLGYLIPIILRPTTSSKGNVSRLTSSL